VSWILEHYWDGKELKERPADWGDVLDARLAEYREWLKKMEGR
jgi:hypothetical protein